ncbi:hypothetical protein PHYSODRAFT_322570 [Phytophthora sojae]|uniref:Uncharacterized protein n=1 Tax=Phytophthora sojae (strain P6497) TaxID=1094619 RepID=G4YPX3_PHYSP|nr:hypothetical protein PHYSODRAFT_322570 [Phytophthora sojae]EGZ28968.1 hypothetical protein PHYSODRAFT_322570 [Phytophthora sojae]|eukprot:XP_009516243.1 hypothetical protein PHYSODRAFT_322570 [Phytophthora sojae]
METRAHPPKRVSQDPALGGRTVRLEAPDELAGNWDGPVYATLSRETKLLQPTDRGPFCRDEPPRALQEHVDVQFWIPHWRLTLPSRDLSGELLERPLLSLFRFVRVVAYSPASSLVLVDEIDVLLEPGSGFICYVAIRHFVSEARQIVVVPLDDVRVNHISCAEYVLGFRHRRPQPTSPGEFTNLWNSIPALSNNDASTVMQHIAAAFPSTVSDLCAGRRLPEMDVDQESLPPPVLPLLTSDETRLTPIDELSLLARPSDNRTIRLFVFYSSSRGHLWKPRKL